MKKHTFYEMLEYLTKVYNDSHKNGCRKGMSVVCRLVLAITYWRDYRPMRQMGLDYDVPKSTVCDVLNGLKFFWKIGKKCNFKTKKQK